MLLSRAAGLFGPCTSLAVLSVMIFRSHWYMSLIVQLALKVLITSATTSEQILPRMFNTQARGKCVRVTKLLRSFFRGCVVDTKMMA